MVGDQQGGGHFPAGFLWGASSAAHQIEGQNTNSDWWRAEQIGSVPHRSGDACDSWHRWPDDIALLRRLGLNAYRLSVEWARIEPEPGRFDQAVLDHYRRQLEALRAASIEPVVTLQHFTLPVWVADAGAWTNPQTAARFGAFADRVGAALGDLVRWWMTVNEPGVLGANGYLEGVWPPHRVGAVQAYVRHVHGCAAGHVVAREALRARRSDVLASLAFDLYDMQPLRAEHQLDRVAARWYDWLRHGLLFKLTAPTIDWVGVNYYFRMLVTWTTDPRFAFARSSFGPREKTDFGWEIYPPGMYTVLRRAGEFGKPVMVTENGLADAADRYRARFIEDHLRQAHRALQDGVDLRGYLHWSLMDNFEWGEGFTRRFGLAETDFDAPDRRRTPRGSAETYRAIVAANAVALGQSPVRR
jgi:beta-glucosidase